ncbi:mechanosensitive ion channel family protein [Motilimonas pumila]|uniref:Mechanosensitive ion channel family protein n=1 Tax=Motilimonas pumila TaxID=2303987 RepID=A0A418YA04_9GAMM|nr:mechanosensitive ion channel domain-containing protein [Motilimonas pumila]RJG38605.1 mechanosensitive ion channel family protein [Motilimonas pumila]
MLKTSHHLCRFWLCIVGLCFSLLSFGTNASDAIKLADTSSPSATLSSFMHASEQVIQHWRDETLHLPAAQHAYFQVIRTMDLSQLPNRSRTVVVMERILLLREILDRIDLQEHQRAPDAEQVKQKELDMWRFANTDIVLAKQNTADNAGQFLFSSSTVQNLPRWYRILADYSYNTDVRPDYYQEFLLSPGPLFSKSLIESFPNMFKEMYGPLPLWQWLALLGVLSICKVLISFSFYLGERWDEKWQDRGMSWRTGRILSLVGVVLLLLLASYVIDDGIWVTGGVYQFFSISFLLAQFFFLSWLIMAIFNYFAKIYVYNKHQGKHVDSSLIIVLARIFGGMTIAILGVYVVGYMGFSISPIVAGLGVGGLAVALAIRPVLENVINGLTLYADGGIRIGELCRYGDKLGTIESIGLRSTRIRTLERSLITVPNSEFANMEIDNLERRDKRRMEHILRLRSEVSLDQLKVLIVNIRRLLLQHPHTLNLKRALH